jgi:hypothetical protein
MSESCHVSVMTFEEQKNRGRTLPGLRVCGKKAKNPLTLAYPPAIFVRHYFHRNISR